MRYLISTILILLGWCLVHTADPHWGDYVSDLRFSHPLDNSGRYNARVKRCRGKDYYLTYEAEKIHLRNKLTGDIMGSFDIPLYGELNPNLEIFLADDVDRLILQYGQKIHIVQIPSMELVKTIDSLPRLNFEDDAYGGHALLDVSSDGNTLAIVIAYNLDNWEHLLILNQETGSYRMYQGPGLGIQSWLDVWLSPDGQTLVSHYWNDDDDFVFDIKRLSNKELLYTAEDVDGFKIRIINKSTNKISWIEPVLPSNQYRIVSASLSPFEIKNSKLINDWINYIDYIDDEIVFLSKNFDEENRDMSVFNLLTFEEYDEYPISVPKEQWGRLNNLLYSNYEYGIVYTGSHENGGTFLAYNVPNYLDVVKSMFYPLSVTQEGIAMLYPNPADNTLTISGLNEVDLNSILVFDIQGNEVMSVDIFPTDEGVVLNIQPLAPGTYFISLEGKVYQFIVGAR